jgi:23S rRNA (cytosine1962-C5)-methyltransferase
MGSDLADGDVAWVCAADGTRLGRGMINRRSQIVVRMLSFGEDDTPIETLIYERIRRAIALRPPVGPRRLVNAESDGLPGLVVDRYGAFLVFQISTLGLERRKDLIVRALVELTGAEGIFERSEGDGRKKDGLAPATGVAHGATPPELIEISEEGLHADVPLLIDVRRGHKTGGYLDQRDNRREVSAHCADARVLNVFSYTGAFGLHAARAGATRVVNLDSSAPALELAKHMASRAGTLERTEHVLGDAFRALRDLHDRGEHFDVVIVDPPKFVDSAANVQAGTRAYKDINRVALALIPPGGLLCTFSCSGLIGLDLFQKVLFGAALDAGCDAAIVKRLGQPDDHPVALTFPEGEYLKGLVLRVR